jgi:hypothetical protein
MALRLMRPVKPWRLVAAFVFLRVLHGQTGAEDFAAAERLFRLDNYSKATVLVESGK